jgi:hypothetical protein
MQVQSILDVLQVTPRDVATAAKPIPQITAIATALPCKPATGNGSPTRAAISRTARDIRGEPMAARRVTLRKLAPTTSGSVVGIYR